MTGPTTRTTRLRPPPTALAYAQRHGKVHRNVATLVDPPAKAQRDMQPLTREQAQGLIRGLRGDRHEALYLTALGTGMRQGELLALPTKTTRSQRTLRLPERVVAALAEHRARQAVVPLAGFVFTTAAGQPLDQVNVTRSFQRLLHRLGLPIRRFLDLRHTFATLALEAGEPLEAVSRALGHTSLATTADIYTHWTPVMQERLAQRMDTILAS